MAVLLLPASQLHFIIIRSAYVIFIHDSEQFGKISFFFSLSIHMLNFSAEFGNFTDKNSKTFSLTRDYIAENFSKSQQWR